jgi:hypothetical protein
MIISGSGQSQGGEGVELEDLKMARLRSLNDGVALFDRRGERVAATNHSLSPIPASHDDAKALTIGFTPIWSSTLNDFYISKK